MFGFSIEWGMALDQNTLLDKFKKFFKILQPVIDIRLFVKMGEDLKGSTDYVLRYEFNLNQVALVIRGIINYFCGHYVAYFYSQKMDVWIEFDDDKVKVMIFPI